MTNDNKNQDLIKRYLLGEADGSEAERLEDLYFADDEAFEQLSIGEDELVADYAQNRLTPVERERFETVFLRTSERQDKVRLAVNLYKAAQQENIVFAAETSKQNAFDNETAFGFWQQLLSFLRNRQPAAQLSFAAIVLILVLGGVWFIFRNNQKMQEDLTARLDTPTPAASVTPTIENINSPQILQNANSKATTQKSPTAPVKETPRNTNQTALPAPPQEKTHAPVTAFLALSVGGVRSGGETKTLQLAPETTDIRLKLDFETDEFKDFTADVSTVDGRVVWRGQAVSNKSQTARSVSVNLPARRLAPGDYLVKLSGKSKTGASRTIEEYYFTVKR